jgi:hypothetical protein
MGKPRPVNPVYGPLNKIGGCELTQGSEPSQYLEENKSREIPKVAASEIGTA